ncbi:putative altered inheritance of mitochondria protein 31, mitochondrial [Amylocarpus encephaloides]|uniref:Altered inheritance of mitochondria protein 31, mitochondrial n=1 Tax=Amylocarpus encephaloides TaxID=45428 RepID=A0A9P7YIW4_9HELO|nr:putative altered inheritance of mitochondria protein 31, mitochondrial [Amylocarpus encephaloides]
MSNPLPSSFDGNTEFYEENRWQKLKRRVMEEPLIPLGCLLTSAAIIGATKSIRAGDHNKTQRMFRARIIAQGFTLLAMVAGSVYWDSDRRKRKEFDSAVDERKKKEKNEAWIRELEVRDQEEKEIKAARERRIRKDPSNPDSREAKSIVEGVESRRPGVLKMVQDLLANGN